MLVVALVVVVVEVAVCVDVGCAAGADVVGVV